MLATAVSKQLVKPAYSAALFRVVDVGTHQVVITGEVGVELDGRLHDDSLGGRGRQLSGSIANRIR